MKEKRVFHTELAYLFGLVILAIGTAFMERADFGVSMVVAPAYLLHLKVSEYLPFFSFGMSEYVFQAALIVLLSVVMGRVKKSYLLSFGTAFLYGIVLDGAMAVVALIPFSGMVWRIVFYIVGLLTCATGVAFFFHTYFPPEVYELLVKEFSLRFSAPLGRTKTIYDCCSCLLSIALSLCFFGGFVGISWGTVACALLNGWLIGLAGRFLEARFLFRDAFPWKEKLQ